MKTKQKINAVSLAVHNNAVWLIVFRKSKAPKPYTWFSSTDSIEKLSYRIQRFIFMREQILKGQK